MKHFIVILGSETKENISGIRELYADPNTMNYKILTLDLIPEYRLISPYMVRELCKLHKIVRGFVLDWEYYASLDYCYRVFPTGYVTVDHNFIRNVKSIHTSRTHYADQSSLYDLRK